jgi:CheY-like chemotaxis protein
MSAELIRACHLLYIEDNPLDVRLFEEALLDSGKQLRMTVLTNGEDAISFVRLQTFRPDVIVLDLELPKVHGIEVLAAIKADNGLNGIPLLVFVDPRTPHFAKVKQLGADCYFKKPMLLEEYDPVLQAVDKMCGGKSEFASGAI